MDQINKEELEYIEQQSLAWKLERQGKFTASEFHRLVADASRAMTEEELRVAKEAKSRKTTIVDPTLLSDGAITYVLEVLGEILTGESADSDRTTKEMDWGILYEPQAAKLYEMVKKVKLRQVGSIPYKHFPDFVSGSPDRLIVDTNNGIEIKCPFNNHIHIQNMMIEEVWQLKQQRKEYYWQCIGGILLTGADFWDFVSYSPNFPFRLQLHTVPIYREDVIEDITLLAIKLKIAVKHLKELIIKFSDQD